MNIKSNDLKKDFKELFLTIAPHKNRLGVFSDFIFCMAAAYKNSIHLSDIIEDQYLKTINEYSKNDRDNICKLFSLSVLIADSGCPQDHLGEFYMEMNFSNCHSGQHFTPSSISNLLARLQLSNINELIKNKSYADINDPACGSGSTFLACINYCLHNNINPQKQIFIQGQDIDKIVALICYVQLCMWHIPCEIVIGDTLKCEVREVWHSPAYHLGLWKFKLKVENKLSKPNRDSKNQVNFIMIGSSYT